MFILPFCLFSNNSNASCKKIQKNEAVDKEFEICALVRGERKTQLNPGMRFSTDLAVTKSTSAINVSTICIALRFWVIANTSCGCGCADRTGPPDD